jgi:protein-disulfide isomerase
MRKSIFIGVAALSLALAGCGGTAEKGDTPKGEVVKAVKAPEGKQWADVISKTAANGYLVGNPDAPIKLIEYASVTCSHCREFEEQGYEELLRDYVGTGKVSFELRNFLLNPYDVPITILTRCAGPESYLALTQQFFQNQTSFLEAAQKIDPAKMQAAMQLPENQRFVALAQEMGAIDFFKSRGISEDQAKMCLSKPENAQELVALTEKGTKDDKVTGTPGFVLNGVPFGLEIGTPGWQQVERRLQEAGAR